jgi:hypothetical protein
MGLLYITVHYCSTKPSLRKVTETLLLKKIAPSYDHIITLIYIQYDVTLRSLFYLETALHVSGGTTTHHQEHIQLYLQHLVFATPFPLPAAIMEDNTV